MKPARHQGHRPRTAIKDGHAHTRTTNIHSIQEFESIIPTNIDKQFDFGIGTASGTPATCRHQGQSCTPKQNEYTSKPGKLNRIPKYRKTIRHENDTASRTPNRKGKPNPLVETRGRADTTHNRLREAEGAKEGTRRPPRSSETNG